MENFKILTVLSSLVKPILEEITQSDSFNYRGTSKCGRKLTGLCILEVI